MTKQNRTYTISSENQSAMYGLVKCWYSVEISVEISGKPDCRERDMNTGAAYFRVTRTRAAKRLMEWRREGRQILRTVA